MRGATIIEYLIDRYGEGRFAPLPNTPERLRYTYWLHYAEGSAIPPLLLKLVFDRIEQQPMPSSGLSASVRARRRTQACGLT